MKFTANDYEPKEVFRILREWTNLTQEELGKLMNKKGRAWAKNIESGRSRYYFEDILAIAKKHKIKIIFEKDKTDN